MDFSEARRRYPLDKVEVLLNTRHLSQQGYLECKEALEEWGKRIMGRNYPITLHPDEVSSMDFVDYQLNDEEKDAASEWLQPASVEFYDLLDEVVKDGYRIAYTMDVKNQCVTVTLICRSKDGANVGRAMSTRHASVQRAVQLALFKHVVVFNQGSWGEAGPESMFG